MVKRDDKSDFVDHPTAPTEEQVQMAQREVRRRNGPRPGTVIVGCKIPNGIILQLSVCEETNEPVMGGGHRGVKVWRKTGDTYTVAGPSVPFGMVPKFVMAGGYRYTFGIPKDFWETWCAQNKDADILNKKLIVAHESMDYLEDECMAHEGLMSGLEPIDPLKPPKGFHGIIERAER